MHLGLLSSERLSFDPLKPIILSGPSTEEGSVVFSGNVILSLGKPTKVALITVQLKSIATTYWPEGIGSRGTRLSHDKSIDEQSVTVFDAKCEKKGYATFPAGIHRFVFTFVIPNSTVETIEDMYGRVKHTVEARVTSPGISLLNSWHITKPVLVLRTYLSNGMLTNHSIQDLSRTFEKHLPALDLQLMVEQAAFSSGELFHVRLIVQPQIKQLQLEHMELSLTETRRYSVPEMHALRTDCARFALPFLSAQLLQPQHDDDDAASLLSSAQSATSVSPHAAWAAVFNKHGPPMPIHHTLADRLTFTTPTCVRNCHHSTTFKDILIRHHLAIHLSFSYPDANSLHSTPSSSPSASTTTTPHQTPPPSPGPASEPQGTWISKLRKTPRPESAGRKKETIKLELPIDVYDCRLKEDFGRLPSYCEIPHASPDPCLTSSSGKQAPLVASSSEPSHLQPDTFAAGKPNDVEAYVFLCPCYFAFRRQVERASQVQLDHPPTSIDPSPIHRIPSQPPPDYVQ
ncbi:hypothetical protein DM01DRAFT_1382359 [Hesseltinella vesiculosa]|uniref:Arrestin-like N-terminal domain-containing protein n=1 Tax=Hesseltinella vesiculosa TaxID=101127 RepID=A0A1X2GM92_9FUNG|nr:hypothetical protein DM01DRAFT_1382359 [Hesseltinella vesiculosa]